MVHTVHYAVEYMCNNILQCHNCLCYSHYCRSSQLSMHVCICTYLLSKCLGKEGLSRWLKSPMGKYDILWVLLPWAVFWVVDESRCLFPVSSSVNLCNTGTYKHGERERERERIIYSYWYLSMSIRARGSVMEWSTFLWPALFRAGTHSTHYVCAFKILPSDLHVPTIYTLSKFNNNNNIMKI